MQRIRFCKYAKSRIIEVREVEVRQIFYVLLLLTIIGEFFLPWILKHFYKNYDSRKMVMSALGNPESPVRKVYNVWLVWLGIFLVVVSFVLFSDIKKVSMVLAVLTAASVMVFAIGAGILSGIFSVNESKEVVTTASKIHGVGAAIGFMMLLFFPLLYGLVSFKTGDKMQGVVCIVAFVMALVFFIFFIMGDKEELKNTIFAYEGLWERLTLFFMYVPFLYMAVQNF